MFGTDELDLKTTLATMEREARERSNFNQSEAKLKFREYVTRDARFAGYDPDALVNRVIEVKSRGAVLDLEDPRLRGESEARLGDRSKW